MALPELDLTQFQGLEEEVLVDTAEGGRRYLLVGANGSHVKLAPGAYHLVKGVHAGRSFAELASEFSVKGGREVTPAEVESAYSRVASLLVEIAGQSRRDLQLPEGFWLRMKLVPARAVARLASALSVAYHPLAAAFLVAFIVATSAWAVLHRPAQALGGSDLWLGYLLFVASLIAHEFGHASASARYGAPPSDIGFALYLVYPAFYSDVTTTWRLNRGQRVVVDLGGTYFQFVALGLLVLIQGVSPPIWAAYALSFYGALFSLNPIFRFDGYWLLADALGVTNLSKQPGILARRVLDRLRRRPVAALPWPPWLVAVLSVYSLLAFAVWGYFLARIVPWAAEQLAAAPGLVVSTWRSLATEGWTDAAGERLALVTMQLFFLVLIGFALWGLARIAVRRVHSGWIIRRARRVAGAKAATLESRA